MRILSLLTLSVALIAIGCSPDSRVQVPAPSDVQLTTQVSEGITTVSLNVPNMHCGSCAASVRGALAGIPGVRDIRTDIPERICSFELSDPELDYESTLQDLASSNQHLADYTIR